MLYVTTRDKYDAYTTPRVLCEARGDDDGYYIPMTPPVFTPEELSALTEKGFSHCIAEILNLFFGSKLTSWDVEFCIGRQPVKISPQRQQIYMAELWHNLELKYDRVEKTLLQRLNENNWQLCSEGWVRIGVRIAVLFGVYALLLKTEHPKGEEFDLVLTSEALPFMYAAWYARGMGLPLGKVICACEDNSQLWDFMRSGHTAVGERYRMPEEMERLLCCEFGWDEARNYALAYSQNDVYSLEPEALEQLRNKLFVSVVSGGRCEQTIPNVYNTNGYVLGIDGATAYSALLDYRAKNGGMRPSVVLCCRHPGKNAQRVSSAMGITPDKLKELTENH